MSMGPFSFDPFITMLLLAALAIGIGQILLGSAKHSQAFSRPPGKPRNDQLKLWQQLLKWQVAPPGYAVPAELEEFACARDFIQSSAKIGGGFVIGLAAIGSAAISLATTRSLLSLWAGNGYIFGATFLFASLMGYSLGYVYGVWQLRRLTARKIAYGDLKPRRLADYRSALFPWIAGALTVYTLLIPLLLAPALGTEIPLSPFGGMDAPTWTLEVIPAAILLVLIAGEVVMARIARLPRLLLIANPQIAQRADNLLRAMTIGQVQGFVFAVIGYLSVAQGFILQQFFRQITTPQGWRPYGILFTLELVFPWMVGLAGLTLPMLAGSIGGKITGWPWQPVRVP